MLAIATQTFGDYLRTKRESRMLRQQDVLDSLAERGLRKYAHTAIIHWEKNRTLPPIHDPKFVKALADILDVTEAEILNAAGFSLQDTAPDELPPDIIKMLRTATPKQRQQIKKMMQLMLEGADADDSTH